MGRSWRNWLEAYRGREEKKEEVEFCKVLTKTCRDWDICQRLKRNPRRPVVGMQFGGAFNEALSMELGELEELFLVMTDRATYYSQNGWLGSKNSKEIIRVVKNG